MNPLRPLTPPQLATLLASGDCPRPERIYEAVAGELGAEERDTVLAHASRCDACGAELALARAFAEPAAADAATSGAVAAADIGWIVGELERRRGQEAGPAGAPTTPELARVLPMPARSRRGHPGGWLAAAASVLLAVGGLYLTTHTAAPPSVPPPPTTDVLRSAEIAWETPLGRLATLPSALRWSASPGAVRYRLTAANAATRAPLWSGESTTAAMPFPPALAARIEPFVTVELRVEALSADGAVLALSAPVALRLER
jgi:hypothetical protein